MSEQEKNKAEEAENQNTATNNDTAQSSEENSSKEATAEANSDSPEQAESQTEDKVGKLEAELSESKDKYLRLYAEFENFRRRTTKEKTDLIKNANESLLKDFLGVIDDFERAQNALSKPEELAEKDEEAIRKELAALRGGVELVYQKTLKLLEQKGLKMMPSGIGKPFDIETQETISQIPAPNEEMKGKVVDEVEKGYYLHDKVLRFAKVVIGS